MKVQENQAGLKLNGPKLNQFLVYTDDENLPGDNKDTTMTKNGNFCGHSVDSASTITA
jgi:hypothetical protein